MSDARDKAVAAILEWWPWSPPAKLLDALRAYWLEDVREAMPDALIPSAATEWKARAEKAETRVRELEATIAKAVEKGTVWDELWDIAKAAACQSCGKPMAMKFVSATGYCSCPDHLDAVSGHTPPTGMPVAETVPTPIRNDTSYPVHVGGYVIGPTETRVADVPVSKVAKEPAAPDGDWADEMARKCQDEMSTPEIAEALRAAERRGEVKGLRWAIDKPKWIGFPPPSMYQIREDIYREALRLEREGTGGK